MRCGPDQRLRETSGQRRIEPEPPVVGRTPQYQDGIYSKITASLDTGPHQRAAGALTTLCPVDGQR
ncbi:MAG: hypothetical protein M9947_17710 [Thermomicrobiales bacterium]|nr:hypothetical protein [Thermomicrobiales bacterium]